MAQIDDDYDDQDYDITADYDPEAYLQTELISIPTRPKFGKQYESEQRQNVVNRKRKMIQDTEALAQKCKAKDLSLKEALDQNLDIAESLKRNALLLHKRTDDKIFQRVLSAAIDAEKVRASIPGAFQLFRAMSQYEIDNIPELRKGVQGVPNVPFKYHEINNNVGDTRSLIDPPPKQYVKKGSETLYKVDKGPPIHPELFSTLRSNAGNMFDSILNEYCRPTTTTDAVVMDFLAPQTEYKPMNNQRCSDVLNLIKAKMYCVPYQPIHYRDFPLLGFPMNTGAGYYVRYKDALRRMSKYTHSDLYTRASCKGFHAATLKFVSEQCFDTLWKTGSYSSLKISKDQAFRYAMDFLSRPSILFARSHVSKWRESLKIRSVIGVDDMFLFEEMMLSFSFLVMQRLPQSCLAYGYETFRGGCKELARISKKYGAILSIDWSSFDHQIAWHFADLFFGRFLPSMIIINKGWQESILTTNQSEDLDPDIMYQRCRITLNYLHTWFRNMVYVSTDGYAYRRSYCGIPSGLMNTQILDSFCNLCLIFDALLECSSIDANEIMDMFIVVQGDDVIIYAKHNDSWASEFLLYATTYSLDRWGSLINFSKSKTGSNTNNIDFLGFNIGEGHPTRPVDKLVAQLMWPERAFNRQVQASRAVGIAIANTGSDFRVHKLCHAVYDRFIEHHKFTDRTFLDFQRTVDPSQTGMILDKEGKLTFPDYFELAHSFRVWQGPLDHEPRWPTNHFLGNKPDHLTSIDRKDIITMEDYENNSDMFKPEYIDYDKTPFYTDDEDTIY